MKAFRILVLMVLTAGWSVQAQPPSSKEQQELERQRQQLKKEIEQTQKLLEQNKKSTKENLGQLQLYNRKINLQGNVIDNISKDINLLDNNIYRSQRDINKLTLLLDTLKQEYAKSMVYAYKNRSNSDFLNFIFSASSFNDVLKRVTYLKSYRNYREIQGENISRTQQLLRSRIAELSGTKKQKSVVLEVQSKELTELQKQKDEKDKLVKKLKAQSKELSAQVAAKKKQMQKVNAAIASAIKRAQDEAIREAKLAADKAKRDADASVKTSGTRESRDVAATTKPARSITPKRESVLLASDADVKLNASFESNRGSLPWPVDRGFVSMGYDRQRIADIDIDVVNPGITIQSEVGSQVKAVFEGEVSSVTNIDNMQVVIIKHGRYFSTYSNLTGVNLSRGQQIRTGQVLGRVAPNDEGVGSIDLIISNERGNMNPESWLRRR